MRHAIETLEKELSLVEEGIRTWCRDFQDIKKRQESIARELKKAIEILKNDNHKRGAC